MPYALEIAKFCAQCPYCRWVVLLDAETLQLVGNKCQHYAGADRVNSHVAIKFVQP